MLLDAEERPCDESEATQASIQGCIRIAANALCPGDSRNARDLAWHTATHFQRHIGYGITTYDHDTSIDLAQAVQDLREAAQSDRAEPER